MSVAYDRAFFEDLRAGADSSARAIVPLVLALTAPRSVVDVGCATGAWLRVFAEHGVDDYMGVDGYYIDSAQLQIPLDRFLPVDLERPVPLGRSFDLAVCLEVAEHLRADCAPHLVKYLTGLASVVLFSAAFPGQGGTHHVNERWPWYWEQQFAERGFVRLDPIRAQVWREPEVQWWYKQNIVLYAAERIVATRPELAAEYERTLANPLELVHAQVLRVNTESTRRLLQSLPSAIRSTIRRRWAAVLQRSW